MRRFAGFFLNHILLPAPSIAGIWPPDAGLPQPIAEEHISKSIQVAEALKARTMPIACLKQNCPKMDEEKSYWPVFALLQKVAGVHGELTGSSGYRSLVQASAVAPPPVRTETSW